MKSLRIIFPDQLSKNNPVLIDIDTNDFLLFYEPIDTFYEIKHHKHKLVLLLSAFRSLVSKQTHKNIIHHRVSKGKNQRLADYLKDILHDNDFDKILISKPSDFKVYKDLMFFCQSNEVELSILDDKKFISSDSDFEEWASDKKTRIQEYYYRWLLKKYIIFYMSEKLTSFYMLIQFLKINIVIQL